ncbi:hypothetical protein [Lysobacter enzymogenes]|uniref:hypothetical protein n=1 Tax=Lysobacter enzymogenes TaxID=69 RepID=UPI00197BB764|nr:hypothetical protein [Lysobacter enzymogenes]
MRQYNWSSGVMPHIFCSVRSGKARRGMPTDHGWVGVRGSPSITPFGAGRCSTGVSGEPSRRSSTKVWPRLVGTMIAGTGRPSLSG